MAFKLFGSKNKTNDIINLETPFLEIKELQDFLLHKISNLSKSEISEWQKVSFNKKLYSDYIKNELPSDSVIAISNKFNGLLPHGNGSYFDYFYWCKYNSDPFTIEGFYLKYGKEALDELIFAIKLYLDRDLMYDFYKSGNWKFPFNYFYEQCIDVGITSIHSEFSKQKVKDILISQLNARKVPAIFHEIYTTDDKLVEFMESGKALYDDLVRAKALQLNEEKNKPKKGTLKAGEVSYIELSNRLKTLTGIDKRICMLDDSIAKLSKKIQAYREGQEAMALVGAILSSSVKQEKTMDWSFLGGLANGLAGPGAGMTVAASIIEENAVIEKRNATARKVAEKTINGFYKDAASMTSSIVDLENEKKLMEHYLKEAGFKSVLEQYSTNDIYKKLDIDVEVLDYKDNTGLYVSVRIINQFDNDEFDRKKYVIDGTLKGEIYCNNMLLDTICIPLPLFGVSDVNFVHMCSPWYVEVECTYEVKISPNHLCILEI